MPPRAQSADPQPYTVAIVPTGEAALDQALQDSSNLVSLRDQAPVGPFALVSRARDDQGRMEAALSSYGHYAARLRTTVAGRPLDDPALPSFLETATGPVEVRIGIEPGPVFKLRQVTLGGDPTPEARAALQIAPGDPAIAANVLAAQGRMLDAMRASGHALAKVAAPVVTLDPGAQVLDISYAVQAGPRVNLGPVTVGGLERVNEGFVRRRLLVHQGDRYDPAAIEAARQDLAQLGVFATVRAQAAEGLDAAGQLPLGFDVTERPRHAVGVTAAFSTDQGASLGVTFQHRNLFGSAEKLDLGAAVTQLGGSASRGMGYNATAALTKPDLWARNQSLTVNLQAVKENLDAYDRTAVLLGAALTRKLSDRWTVSAGLLAQQSQITQEGVTRDYTLLGVPISARYDSTGIEGLFEPTHGIKAALTVTPTASLAGGGNFVVIQATGSTYINLGAPGRSVLALRATAASVQGASTFQLPPDQRLYAGGSATVRGYKYQSIGPKFPDLRPTGGTALAAATVEFRQRFGESLGAVIFADAGQVDGASTPFGGNLRASAGLGARYYTAIGPIRLDVAVPLNKLKGDDAFELYIGIGQAF